jgi:hypothetical protein
MEVDGARDVDDRRKAAVKAIGRVIYRLGGRASPNRREAVTDVSCWLARFDFVMMVRTRFNADLYRRWLKKN